MTQYLQLSPDEQTVVTNFTCPQADPPEGYAEVEDNDPRWLAYSNTVLQAEYTAAIQMWLDGTARSSGYDNIVSAVSYADDTTVPLYQHQGQAFRTWRALVWQAALSLLAQVQAGQAPVPASTDALIAQLPQPSIPTS